MYDRVCILYIYFPNLLVYKIRLVLKMEVYVSFTTAAFYINVG